jgi:hypothetical protein
MHPLQEVCLDTDQQVFADCILKKPGWPFDLDVEPGLLRERHGGRGPVRVLEPFAARLSLTRLSATVLVDLTHG